MTSYDDSHVTLTLEKATLEDAGWYSCTLSNAAGSAKSSGQIIVRALRG